MHPFLSAAATGTSSLADYLGIPAGAAGIGIPLYLWLSQRIQLTSDVDRRVKELQDRIDSLEADRDAWRQAHTDEVAARVAAERAGAALLDSATLSTQLLATLRDQLTPAKSQRPTPRTPRRRT